MSGQVWKKFEAMMAEEVLIKTAAKSDSDYNVVPEGSEECGWELVELAHPEQIQVARSQNEDGIVENGVEAQKVMIDVALRNPRGVILAELMQTLVKAAAVLEEKPTDENLKVVAEIDDVLMKLAQQDGFLSKDAQFAELLKASQRVVGEFDGLNWARFQFVFSIGEKTKQKEIIEDVSAKLRSYIMQASGIINTTQKAKWTETVATIIKINHENVIKALDSAREGTVFIDDANKAKRAWRDAFQAALLVSASSDEKPSGIAAIDPNKAREELMMSTKKQIDDAAQQHAPSHTSPRRTSRGYSVAGPKVKELQMAVGADPDGKFGQQTFNAVMSKTKDNYGLRHFLQNNPDYMGGYDKWDETAVEFALSSIRQFENKPSQSKEDLYGPDALVKDKEIDPNIKFLASLSAPRVNEITNHLREKYGPGINIDPASLEMIMNNGRKINLRTPQMLSWIKKEMGWA